MNVLMVPVRLDALILEKDQNVTEASADFSKMPYFNGLRDINPDTPNLSEALLSKVFQNNNLVLRAGVHLHWSLPDALTHGTQSGNDMSFPAVPNRWLVSRFRESATGAKTPEKQWMVESDYLYPQGEGADSGSVSFPVETASNKPQPFRYLGRVMPLADWTLTDKDEYLPQLTALGYGDPMFAAFYPNCHSVFGFHNDLPENLAETSYEIIGWYSDGANDHLHNIRTELTAEGLIANKDIIEGIKQRLEWETVVLEAQTPPAAPEEMICYARIRFSPEGEITTQAPDDDVQIAVGNTAAEALAAYLGRALGGETRQIKIENQLESLRLSTHLRDKELDLAARLREARHDRGFTPSGDGILWSIQDESEQAQNEALSLTNNSQPDTLPDTVSLSLNHLNDLQQQYTRLHREINALREQTFTDWYKYMAATYPPGGAGNEQYPDIDEIRFFIETRDLTPLNQKRHAAGVLELQTAVSGSRVISARSDSDYRFSLAYRIAREINTLLASLAAFNQKQVTEGKSSRFSLMQVAAPRFWKPNDPVILVKGEAVKPGQRHGRDGLLRCELLSRSEFSNMQTLAAGDGFGLISKAIDSIEIEQKPYENRHHGFTLWNNQPWNPLALQWRSEVRPVLDKGNLQHNNEKYDTDFILDNYALTENKPELKFLTGKGGVTRAASIITGHCILTPGAAEQAKERIESYLIENTRAADETELHSDLALIIAEKKTEIDNQKKLPFDDPVYTMLKAYEELQKGNHLSQSLDGFHEALLMRKKTLQLEPADPISFFEYRDFTNQQIRDAMQDATTEAPAALNDFLPLRSGGMELIGLRVLDSFGRYLDVEWDREILTRATSLSDPDQPDLIALPPRLCQPARLNFRFLASRESSGEMNSLPNTNPICGWLMPNYLDDSLMVYGGEGVMLGYINKTQEWRAAPGDVTPVAVEGIENVYLRRVVRYLMSHHEEQFHADFISSVNRALENIDPENYAQHQAMALLVGRPMAVVRASLNIELEGPPALHQGWMALHNDMGRHERETDGFEHVKFPIRLGEFKQSNDGLVGYWLETEEGIEDKSAFYAPQSDISEKQDFILSHGEGNTLAQSIADAPQLVTMLMDPRGTLHATCGILPVKEINLPTAQYVAALENIEAVFLRAPVITPAARFATPLSQQSDHIWSWLEREDSNWQEISSQGILKKAVLLENFPAGEIIWEELLAKNWIRVRTEDPTKADVVAVDERKVEGLDKDFVHWPDEIEALLDATFIHQPGSSADFPGPIEIREGWLRLAAKK